jgi:predicted Fe-Mo cluster-binding NifX family protein
MVQIQSSSNALPAGAPTAVLVMNGDQGPTLCPLFAKCDGVLLIERDGSTSFHPNTQGTARALSDLVQSMGPHRLLCSFIGPAEKKILRAAGIDIRVGSCAYTIDELVADFSTLPKA